MPDLGDELVGTDLPVIGSIGTHDGGDICHDPAGVVQETVRLFVRLEKRHDLRTDLGVGTAVSQIARALGGG
jgi:hypothetical protein